VTAEQAALKAEQLERIKQRDSFLNLNIVAVGVVTAIAVQGQRQAGAWLVIPWITVILGWAYLANDDKVTAIARHLADSLDPRSAAGSWETGAKGLLPPPVRRLADSVVFLFSFIIPTPVAVAMYVTGRSGMRTWFPQVVVIVGVEATVGAGLCAAYVMSVRSRRRAA
jgi:hypothetical protein